MTFPLRSLAVLAPAAMLLLGGCAAQVRGDLGSPYYAVPEGSTLELHRPVTIPPGRTRVFLQDGEVSTGFDSYRTSCALEITELADRPRMVEPDSFRVTRTQRIMLEEVVEAEPLRLAAVGFGFGIGFGPFLATDDGGAPMVYEGWHLWLESPRQPGVRRLSCRGVFADVAEAEPPSIREIREALGGLASLVIAGPTSPAGA